MATKNNGCNAKRRRAKEVRSWPSDVEAVDKETKREKKKPKTKFTEAQQMRMKEFAENKLGWRVVRHDKEEIQNFCEEIGIDPSVYKAWINNNRHHQINSGESPSNPKK